MANPSTLLRVFMALALLGLLLVIDFSQRPESAPAPTAVLREYLAAGAPLKMKETARGSLPMRDGDFAAHASNLIALPDSHPAALLAFWFAGDRESAPNVQIVASEFDRATQSWSAARAVVNRQAVATTLGYGVRRLGNPVAWLDARGRLHLFVVATGWGGWAASRILHLRQASAGMALDHLALEPVGVLPLSWFWNISFLVRNPPMALDGGGMVLPAYFELGVKYPCVLRFDHMGNLLGMTRISQRPYALQPALLALSSQHWLALMRDSRADGRIITAGSVDGGRHWNDLADLDLVNPDSAIAAMALGHDNLLLAANSSAGSRAWLDLSASQDGRHWTTVQEIAHGQGDDEYSYPSLAWADGSLWVSYTDHRRSIAWHRLGLPPENSAARP
jgi:predicted neuraminidase